jgi:glutamate dehydrogenase
VESFKNMYDDDVPAFSTAALQQAFARELGSGALSEAEIRFVAQVADDVRAEEIPDVQPADLAASLARFWRFADQRDADVPKLRLSHALGADARDLKLELLEIVQDDAPFLVDSVMGELAAAGIEVRAMFHPVVKIARDAQGQRSDSGEAREESMILVVLSSVGEDRREALLEALRLTLADVHAAVRDGAAMHALMRQVAAELTTSHAPFGVYGAEEYAQFLQWLSADRFIFLGARAYDYPRAADGTYAAEEPNYTPEDCLGVLRDMGLSVLRRASEPAILTSDLAKYLEHAEPLIVAKSTLKSRVHRRGYMDYIGVKRYDAQGRAIGEVRFVGLFTAEAYEDPARHLPLVRRKIEHVLARAGQNPSAHTGKRLRTIAETYPRDELFQIDEETLYQISMGVLHLFDRPRVRLFWRVDTFDRFVSALLYVPLDRFDSELQDRAGKLLAKAWGGRVSAVYPYFSDQPLARVHYIIGVSPGNHPQANLAEVEAEIAEAARTWLDRFETAARSGGVAPGMVGEILSRYAHGFPAGYRDQYDAAEALEDISVIEGLAEDEPLRVRAYRRPGDSSTRFRFKLYRPGSSVPLADVLPVLEDMGLKALVEEGFPVTRSFADGRQVVTWVHEFILEDERGERLVFADIKGPFEDAFLAVWTGRTENDGFNRLVLELGATWREVALMRALARYRQQSGLDPSQAVQEATLAEHAEIARLILDMFKIKFDPAVQASVDERKAQADEVFGEIIEALQQVESLDADRVLRRLALLVGAVTRTNFFQTDAEGRAKPYISFKVASSQLEDLPAPKPYREIFVWAPYVEGVHLRFGPVARGGLRWSDRRDDFRTEVLGLVKAQQVKNAVIVPVGSKGGFYPKQLPRTGGPDAVRAEGVRAYKTFLSGLLDVTDNLDAAGAIVRPEAVIAHDQDDPYLVVAADKGTATFSDIANGVARDYGFWLDDAFASGGSAGYDHKAMGITARGAWEAVKRHFREMGKDISVEPFTCVGVGDMSGDVFGNGALLSKAMMLVAAFDHRHIFLDPTPDPATSWAERKRMFDLPRSSWEDYDKSLISKGGGVFPRSAKSIPLSAEVRALLGVEDEALAPADLIRAILKAEVELLYLGGIGTYVKAAAESNAEAGDKANDAVRVDATDLRCKVVGEGANLGLTQAGRISFARLGGRIDTDAIDNSAGVDTSDHEVNIKILLGRAISDGALKAEARNDLLASMTDEVAAHVLRHNYDQTLGLSLQEANAPVELEAHGAFMLDLERKGRLNRTVEGLPRAQALADLRAANRGLTRPELAVITAYGKLELSAAIVASPVADDPYFFRTLEAYFPEAMTRFGDQMNSHRLKREIIATVLANAVVDKAGPTFAQRILSALDGDVDAMLVAFETALRVFRLDEAWREVDGLDYQIPAAAQLALYQELARSLRGQTYWLAKRAEKTHVGVRGLIDAYRPAVDVLQKQGTELLSAFERAAVEARCRAFADAGAPEALARRVALLRSLADASGIADLARAANWPTEAMARLYYETGSAFGYDRLRAAASAISAADGFERAALRGLIIDLVDEQVRRTREIAEAVGGSEAGASAEAAGKAVAGWIGGRTDAVERARRVLDDIEQTAGGWSFAKLTIASAALRGVQS